VTVKTGGILQSPMKYPLNINLSSFSLVLRELPAHPKYKEVPVEEKERTRKVRS